MKRFAALAVSMLVSLAFFGCGDDSSSQADLRVVHGSPDAPDVDVRIDGQGVLDDVPYLASSGYLSVDAGARDIDVLVAGTETVAISATLALAEGTSTTVLATGLAATIQPLVLADDRTPPGPGLAKVRIVHGAPSAPTVDVYVTAPGAGLSSPTLTAVPFTGYSDYLQVPAGDYRVRITPTGTQTVAIDTGTLTIPDGSVLTAIAVDAVGAGAPFDVLLLNDSM